MANGGDLSILYEWIAYEHVHQKRRPEWFAILAGIVSILAIGFVFVGNFIAGLTIGMIGGFIFIIAQHKPSTIRYRVMAEGLAINETLYPYKDLDSFNIIYEPGIVKTVIVKSSKRFVPLVHMELGDADPVKVRDMLVKFIREDIQLEEPIIDVWSRRLGF